MNTNTGITFMEDCLIDKPVAMCQWLGFYYGNRETFQILGFLFILIIIIFIFIVSPKLLKRRKKSESK